jgi:hypothetical protein
VPVALHVNDALCSFCHPCMSCPRSIQCVDTGSLYATTKKTATVARSSISRCSALADLTSNMQRYGLPPLTAAIEAPSPKVAPPPEMATPPAADSGVPPESDYETDAPAAGTDYDLVPGPAPEIVEPATENGTVSQWKCRHGERGMCSGSTSSPLFTPAPKRHILRPFTYSHTPPLLLPYSPKPHSLSFP